MAGEGKKEQGDMWHVQPGKVVYELDLPPAGEGS